MTRQSHIERVLRRRAGASDETKAKMKADADTRADWTARCPVCGALLKGTKAELMAHTHEPG